MAGRYLIDTHVFIELADPTRRLAGPAYEALSDRRSEVFLSTVSVAEMSIKAGLGKLTLPADAASDLANSIRTACEEVGFQILPLQLEHAGLLQGLPLLHRDPFDRMLIVQALHEKLVLISRDRAFAGYEGLALLRP